MPNFPGKDSQNCCQKLYKNYIITFHPGDIKKKRENQIISNKDHSQTTKKNTASHEK